MTKYIITNNKDLIKTKRVKEITKEYKELKELLLDGWRYLNEHVLVNK